jgi:hypothetical protein
MAITATKVPLASHLFILDLPMRSWNAPAQLSPRHRDGADTGERGNKAATNSFESG